MTNAELQEKLKAFPDDLEVVFESEECINEIKNVSRNTVIGQGEEGLFDTLCECIILC